MTEIDAYLDEIASSVEVEPSDDASRKTELFGKNPAESTPDPPAPAPPKRKRKGQQPDSSPTSAISHADDDLASFPTATGATSAAADSFPSNDAISLVVEEDNPLSPGKIDETKADSDPSLSSLRIDVGRAEIDSGRAATSEGILLAGDNRRPSVEGEHQRIGGGKGGGGAGGGGAEEEEDGEIARSVSDLNWSSVVRVTDEFTHEQIDTLVESSTTTTSPLLSSSSSSAVAADAPVASSLTGMSVFTDAFADIDRMEEEDHHRGSGSSSSASPHHDVTVEEVKESDSSSFEYVMASGKDDSSPTYSDYSHAEFDDGAARKATSSAEAVDYAAAAAAASAAASTARVKTSSEGASANSADGSGAVDVKVTRSVSDIGVAAGVDMESTLRRADFEDELIVGLERDEDEETSSILFKVPPMLANDVVTEEFGFSTVDLDSRRGVGGGDVDDDAILRTPDQEKFVRHPFIFAASSCTPAASDEEDSLVPPSFNVSVEQFEDLGENQDANDGAVDVVVDADAESSFFGGAGDFSGGGRGSLGASFESGGRGSLGASFRGASLPRQLSSSALANQLYARSREGSLGESDSVKGLTAEELDGVVKDLRDEKRALAETVDNLKEELAQSRSRADALKSENQSLTARLFEMEDQIRMAEVEAKTREMDDERTLRETVGKLEKQNMEMMNRFAETEAELAAENDELKAAASRTRTELDAAKLDLLKVEDKYLESRATVAELQRLFHATQAEVETNQSAHDEERRRTAEIVDEMTREIDELKAFYSDAQPLVKMRTPSYADLPNKVADLEAELKAARAANADLRETKDELEVQIMNYERGGGDSGGDGVGLVGSPPSAGMPNLEAEMEMASKEELVKVVQAEKDVNKHLKEYVDKIILVILENQPELLEIMATMEVKTKG